jgi:hypothetical protein
VAASRLLSDATHLISLARQGVWTMQHYPFVPWSEPAPNSRHRTQVYDDPSIRWQDVSLVDGDDCPCYDLWHVLFECRATSERSEIVALRASSADFLLQICAAVLDAVECNSQPEHDQFDAR